MRTQLPLFYKSQHLAVADVLRKPLGVIGLDRIVAALSDMFEADNPQFEVAAFSAAVFGHDYDAGETDNEYGYDNDNA